MASKQKKRKRRKRKWIIWAFGVERNAQLLRKGESVKKKKKTMTGDEEKGNGNGVRNEIMMDLVDLVGYYLVTTASVI